KKAPVFIAHVDNPEGASELKKEIKGFCKNIHTCEIGPVIGAHVGSGMLALVFLGERNLS
ncbi:MAG: DegV family protein, partial [Ruminococcus sp.]|nr:DegV family protein [Ruminococcus sp.]